MAETALIVGSGSGLSASLARLFAKEGMRVALAARDTSKLASLVKETGALPVACDAAELAQRGLAQSMARELAPKGIHVAHFVIDGGIARGTGDPRAGERAADGMLLPDEIAKNYLHVYRQHRSAWTWEIELRPWVERF